ncbi:LacI family DNA-binding transcriptional regulator [Mesorhizobium sp. NBSH29]|uniref:LacI family DNA-binding transcriptional regulator n=1 Tax=Mesorhizobium sp. NBSH29 TaxID=2654249 RepID=UPI001896668F|nr:LacI family DNA-binding transcriptional regulator [Mesorhizobium sp. NBSH29]QPC87877.1 LacI family DNA-binding transcriptional regulator [Mesorhizobium sp. NBSH29]
MALNLPAPDLKANVKVFISHVKVYIIGGCYTIAGSASCIRPPSRRRIESQGGGYVLHQKLATIEDVAALAGVSIATVSRVVNEPTKVAETTRRRVNDAIARTGYTTNAMARSLRMRRSNMILILAPDVGDPNFSNILVGLETEASKRGYGILIGNTQNDPTRETAYLRFISSNQADGLILLTGHLPFGYVRDQRDQRPPPMVAVNEPVPGNDIPFVGVDNFEGARIAAEHLVSQGHRRIAFVGRSSRIVNSLREKGYRAALDNAGIPIDPMLILDGDGTTESGRQAIELMFVRDILPTAFLCVNDATALGVLISLNARGYDLPGRFSVMGFDDISFASFVTPSLTTMKQPRSRIGEAAMNLLLTVVEGKPVEQREVLLRSELILRNSVARLG